MSAGATLPDRFTKALAGRTPPRPREWRQGVISAVNADGSVSLVLGGSATTLTNVRTLAGVFPYAGATVWCVVGRGDALVIGVQEVATSWVTSQTGFTAAANWTINSVRYRRIGSLCWLYVAMDRTTSAVTVAAGNGDIANVTMLSAVPAAVTPAFQMYGRAGAGRAAVTVLASAGTVSLAAVAGDGTNVLVGDTISGDFGPYPID